MNVFICMDGELIRYDAPVTSSNDQDIVHTYGFEVSDADSNNPYASTCRVCRPINNQDVFLNVHGYDRNMYALVVWEHEQGSTLIFVSTPFDLVHAVHQIARYEHSMYEVGHYQRLRRAETPPVISYGGETDPLRGAHVKDAPFGAHSYFR